jgi:hypothetical protein
MATRSFRSSGKRMVVVDILQDLRGTSDCVNVAQMCYWLISKIVPAFLSHANSQIAPSLRRYDLLLGFALRIAVSVSLPVAIVGTRLLTSHVPTMFPTHWPGCHAVSWGVLNRLFRLVSASYAGLAMYWGVLGEVNGAGDGNRTHASSLGSCSSTIELHPRADGAILTTGSAHSKPASTVSIRRCRARGSRSA